MTVTTSSPDPRATPPAVRRRFVMFKCDIALAVCATVPEREGTAVGHSSLDGGLPSR